VAEVTLLPRGLDAGCGPVFVALAGTGAGDEPAPQPVSSAAAMTAAASRARRDDVMLSPAGAARRAR